MCCYPRLAFFKGGLAFKDIVPSPCLSFAPCAFQCRKDRESAATPVRSAVDVNSAVNRNIAPPRSILLSLWPRRYFHGRPITAPAGAGGRMLACRAAADAGQSKSPAGFLLPAHPIRVLLLRANDLCFGAVGSVLPEQSLSDRVSEQVSQGCQCD